MDSKVRAPLKEITSGVNDNLTVSQNQRTLKLGVSQTKNMIKKPQSKSTTTNSAIPEPPSRRQTIPRTRSTLQKNDPQPVNKRLAATAKRSFPQPAKARHGTRNTSRSGTDATRRETITLNRTTAFRVPPRGLGNARKESRVTPNPESITQIHSMLENVQKNVAALTTDSKDGYSMGKETGERILQTISHLQQTHTVTARQYTELAEEKAKCETELTFAQAQIKDIQSDLEAEKQHVKELEENLQTLEQDLKIAHETQASGNASSEELEQSQTALKKSDDMLNELRAQKKSDDAEAKERQTMLESELNATTTKLKDALRRSEVAEEEKSSTETALRRMRREKDEIEAERMQMEKSLNKRIAVLQEKIDELEATRAELERQKASSEDAKRELDKNFSDFKNDITPQMQALEDERDILLKSNADLQSTVQSKLQELEKFKEITAMQERKVSALNADKMSQDLRLDALHRDLAASRTEVQRLIEFGEEQKRKIEELESLAREDAAEKRRLRNTIQELKGNIRVFCRIRPPLPKEEGATDKPLFVYNEKGQGVVAQSPVDERTRPSGTQSYPFKFDRVFDPSCSQDNVFEEISQLVQSAIDGYRVCIFAYGQTGSGKTYTMLGERNGSDAKLGMIPRSIRQVFETARSMEKDGWTFTLKASFLEIYNESIRDLLVDSNASTNGKAKEENRRIISSQDRKSNTVTDLSVETVVDEAHIQKLISKSMKNRATAATRSNERSSRSHSVFRLYVHGKNDGTKECRDGLLNLIDLAGSERLEKSKAEGERLRETRHINKSLSALGDVISALATKEKHIPYRNSKLTHLLQDSLGGDSKALMFVNLSHASESFNESLCSLRFAAKVNNCHVGTAKRSAKIDV